MTRIVIMGGGPAGYEAALVAAQHGGDVTVVERDGMGGACVLDDCVPSKTLIASAGVRVELGRAPDLGFTVDRNATGVDLPRVNARVASLAMAQSADVRARVEREGVRIIRGSAAFADEPTARGLHAVEARTAEGGSEVLAADVVLVATGATPRVLDDAKPDGERILTWRQLYDLTELPEHLVVVGSGVTGAEFVSAYVEMGARVTLVSSRDRVLPGEDADAAAVLQDVFAERGVEILAQARAESVRRDGDGVVVTLADGRTVTGSHALMTVGSVPNTGELGAGEGRHHHRAGRVHRGRPGVPHLRAGHLRGGRLHRRAHARLRRRDAGADRDVARARRRRDADQAQDGVRRRVHPPGDRDGRHQPARDRRGRGARAHDHAAALDEPPGQDAGPAPRAS